MAGYNLTPLYLNVMRDGTKLNPVHLVGEFSNIYSAIRGYLPGSKFNMSSEDYISDKAIDLDNNGNPIVPNNHYEQHQHFKWVIRNTNFLSDWTQKPDFGNMSLQSGVCLLDASESGSIDYITTPALYYRVFDNHGWNVVVNFKKSEHQLFFLQEYIFFVEILSLGPAPEIIVYYVLDYDFTNLKRIVLEAEPNKTYVIYYNPFVDSIKNICPKIIGYIDPIYP